VNVRESILGLSAGYTVWKKVIAADRATEDFVREYVKPQPGEWILDVGCGVGDTVEHLGDVHYVGIDFNQKYIDTATKKHPQGTFVAASVDELPALGLDKFDCVIIQNVLHHLSDDQVQRLVAGLPAVMRPGARLATSDNVWSEDSTTTARVLIALDRGRNVREAHRYAELVGEKFGDIEVTVRHDMLRIPYSHCIVQSRLPGD
jgi:2-polyprenyl-3-methyl-5-hydroxy-6-metoxy-1,4-benzoquinol methylase